MADKEVREYHTQTTSDAGMGAGMIAIFAVVALLMLGGLYLLMFSDRPATTATGPGIERGTTPPTTGTAPRQAPAPKPAPSPAPKQ